MSPSRSKREAVETASRALRARQRAESGQLAAAESALRRADRDRDREARARRHGHAVEAEPAAAPDAGASNEARSVALEETRSVLAELGDKLEADEDALDMAAAVHAGHDGVLVATDRRLMFVAPRLRLSLAYNDVESVIVRGHRWSGTRLTLRSPEGRTTFSAIRPSHARELAELVRGRTGAPAAGS